MPAAFLFAGYTRLVAWLGHIRWLPEPRPGAVRRLLACALVAVLLCGATESAQWWGGRRRMPPRFPSGEPTHRLFTFTRGLYQSTHREQGGQGWFTDYPDADINFTIRFSELTHAPVGFAPRR